MTNPIKCWEEVYKLIVKRKLNQAMALCEVDPYAAVAECQCFLGWEYYESGDCESALKWFVKAIEQGDIEAIFGRGCVHCLLGDLTAAAIDFQEAMDKGYGRACYWLGVLYHSGEGVPKDKNKAACLYEYGAAQGFLRAKMALIDLSFNANAGFIEKTLWRSKRIRLSFYMLKNYGPTDVRILDMPNSFNKYKASNNPHSRWILFH
jgi:TPR repeat protein